MKKKKLSLTPFLCLSADADKVAKYYLSIFKGSKCSDSSSFSASVEIFGQELILFNGGSTYKLTPAASLFISCNTQKEIDFFHSKLSRGGKTMQCGWLTDRFGVTWQIVPSILPDLLGHKNQKVASQAMDAMLKMKKFNIEKLKQSAFA